MSPNREYPRRGIGMRGAAPRRGIGKPWVSRRGRAGSRPPRRRASRPPRARLRDRTGAAGQPRPVRRRAGGGRAATPLARFEGSMGAVTSASDGRHQPPSGTRNGGPGVAVGRHPAPRDVGVRRRRHGGCRVAATPPAAMGATGDIARTVSSPGDTATGPRRMRLDRSPARLGFAFSGAWTAQRSRGPASYAGLGGLASRGAPSRCSDAPRQPAAVSPPPPPATAFPPPASPARGRRTTTAGSRPAAPPSRRGCGARPSRRGAAAPRGRAW